MNREQWLQEATGLIRPWFTGVATPLPDVIHCSVGFPSRGALSTRRKVIGQCWGCQCSSDGAPHVFISPLLHDPIEVLETLVHEHVHAAVGSAAKHGPLFRRPAVALGLVGKMTATNAGPELRERLNDLVVARLPAYPHPVLTHVNIVKQATRLLKAQCADCGYTVRVTQKWLSAVGAPLCPCNERPMETDGEYVRLAG